MPSPPFNLERTARPVARVRVAAVIGGVLCAALLVAGPVLGDSHATAGEYEVKAAFIFNFVKFTTWPREADRNGPMRLCIAGRDPFGPLLESTIGEKTVRGRRFSIRRRALTDDLTGCQIVFVGDGDSGERLQLLESLKGHPILTVGDSDRFANEGGMVGFFEKQRRIRFAVNLDATARSDIRVSSKLLQLASVVREAP